MSVHVSSLVWRAPLAGNEKLVLLKLADCADDEGGNAYPSVARVARECGVSRRTVQTILKRFVSRGLLIVEAYATGGRGKPTRYQIDLERVQHDCTVSHETKGAETAPYPETKGATDDLKGADHDVKGCRAFAPEPSVTVEEESLSPRVRATRLPEGWQPTEEETNYARQKGLSDNEISRLRDDIVDWSQSSPNGAKLNWRATWQTWVRRCVDERKEPTGRIGNRPAAGLSRSQAATAGILGHGHRSG